MIRTFSRLQAAFSELRFELRRAAHGEDFTAGEWTATMTHSGELEGLRASGRRVSSAGVDVATLDEKGQITHLVSYYDGAQIMRALGLTQPEGASSKCNFTASAPDASMARNEASY